MPSPDTIKTLAELEADHIRDVLSALDGNMSRTARALGIDRRTMYRKATALGLSGKGARGRVPNSELRDELEATKAELARLRAAG